MNELLQAIRQNQVNKTQYGAIKVYRESFAAYGNDKLLMIKENGAKKLLVVGNGILAGELVGEAQDDFKLCPLTHANRLVLNRYFPYTAPQAFGTQIATIGLGDRLGVASPGHIKTVRGRAIRPILAQQSVREITLTGRTFNDVLDAASFAVFQEGYKDGFGADGDHLKAESDIRMSLDLGFTMLTLDCSEKIDNTVAGSPLSDIAARYDLLPAATRKHFEERYAGKTFQVGGAPLAFDQASVMKYVLIYSAAIDFMKKVYFEYITKAGRMIDFEISIDETLTPTDPAAHFLVANELYADGVAIHSMAPRFCGEFQKGIDYIGNLAQFEQELSVHAAIADHFGYKLSIHSGSDKFAVFSLIAKYTKGRFHLKTAGTNWLEAMRVVAKVNPSLYRRMHAYAWERYGEALSYYHVTTDWNAIKPLSEVADADLPDYLQDNNARQLIHITYGILLQARDDQGNSLFKDEFFRTLDQFEAEYEQALIDHIGKHLQLLGK
ncbi:MAG TPA: tagaturonate epimerase family protein [Bacilli bacterium]